MKVLKFGAVWCPGCLVMRPRWQALEKEFPTLLTEYYDFDKDKEMVEKFGIDKILPVFVFLDRNDKELLRLTGEVSLDKFREVIADNFSR